MEQFDSEKISAKQSERESENISRRSLREEKMEDRNYRGILLGFVLIPFPSHHNLNSHYLPTVFYSRFRLLEEDNFDSLLTV